MAWLQTLYAMGCGATDGVAVDDEDAKLLELLPCVQRSPQTWRRRICDGLEAHLAKGKQCFTTQAVQELLTHHHPHHHDDVAGSCTDGAARETNLALKTIDNTSAARCCLCNNNDDNDNNNEGTGTAMVVELSCCGERCCVACLRNHVEGWVKGAHFQTHRTAVVCPGGAGCVGRIPFAQWSKLLSEELESGTRGQEVVTKATSYAQQLLTVADGSGDGCGGPLSALLSTGAPTASRASQSPAWAVEAASLPQVER